MKYGGIFGSGDDGVYASRLLEAEEHGYRDVERSAMAAYFGSRTRREWISKSLMGFSLSHRAQSKIGAVYDLVDASRALARACWHLRDDPDRMAIALRAAREFAMWREEEERPSPAAMPPWLQSPSQWRDFSAGDFSFHAPKPKKKAAKPRKKKVTHGR